MDPNLELQDDLSFNAMNIEDKLSRLPTIAVKWGDRLNASKLEGSKLDIRRRKIISKWWKYYCGYAANAEGQMCPLVLEKREITEHFLPSNNEVVATDKLIESNKAVIRELETACKQVTQLYWSMKSWIEWKKFEAGA